MNAALLEQIVETVLYEGYVLYPYRPSSKKNQRERFTFGRVYPEACSQAQGGAEPFVMQTECLVKTASDAATLEVSVRFLQPVAREIGVLPGPVAQFPPEELKFTIVPELRVGDELLQAWHEAAERKVVVPSMALNGDSPTEVQAPFRFFASRDLEPVRDADNCTVGIILRRQDTISGVVELSVKTLQPGLRKITVRIANHTPMTDAELADGEAVLMRTFASTHTILTVAGGEFISLIDPPSEYQEAAVGCKNIGAWPVLVGEEASREADMMLSSPIILYDYPKIAPESAGPLFDGTEIDEILTLRILTMTDEEKREMRRVDEQARRLLERTEALSRGALLGMHGAKRDPEPGAAIEFDDFFGASVPLKGVAVDGAYLQAGDRVRLRPKARADVLDIALDGQTAVIEAVEQDMEKRVHLAVVLDNDPGKDLGFMRQPGHRFFYGVDEVEPLTEEVR
ncbi:MAG TPA: hypothetical protein VN873_10205 [Candidatus Angelobacter sp.]|nr:hypothetical protein [Candidatus Angelobacter sp.]